MGKRARKPSQKALMAQKNVRKNTKLQKTRIKTVTETKPMMSEKTQEPERSGGRSINKQKAVAQNDEIEDTEIEISTGEVIQTLMLQC